MSSCTAISFQENSSKTNHVIHSDEETMILEREVGIESTDNTMKIPEGVQMVPYSLQEQTVRIPIKRGKNCDTVYATIDVQDEERISRYKWYWVHAYAMAKIQNKYIKMHRFILGVTERWQLVDHINCDKLDNRRSNLRICTPSENAQNKMKTARPTSSKFIGVGKEVRGSYIRWKASLAGNHIGCFKSEICAAYAYNQAALKRFGEYARINDISRPEDYTETKRINKPERYIFRNVRGGYQVRFRRNSGRIKRTFKTLEKAVNFRDNELQRRDWERRQGLESEDQRPICRNENGIAIIVVCENGPSSQHALVDDDDYRELEKWKWAVNCNGYAIRREGQKSFLMSRWIMKATDSDFVIDHINHNRLDNRKSNLRVASYTLNAHNRTKAANTTSIYMGVNKDNGKWVGHVTKDGKTYKTGTFDSELLAAWTVDCKARDLYGDDARLNNVPQPLHWEWIDGVAKKRISDNELLSTRSAAQVISKRKCTNTTGYIGVRTVKQGINRFVSLYYHKNKTFRLGSYPSADIAAWIRDRKVQSLYNGEVTLNGVAAPKGWKIVNDRGVYVGDSNNDDDSAPPKKKVKVAE
jgi:hypothetical protein